MTRTPTSSPTDTAPLAGQLGLAVTRLHRHLRRHSAGGLSPTQMTALSAIDRQGPLTLGELAASEQVAPPTITKVVTKLDAHGYVTRTVADEDRRIHRVAVTPAGRRYLDAVRSKRNAWLAERLAELPASDLELLTAAVEVFGRLDREADPK